jgi:hypothetical protein
LADRLRALIDRDFAENVNRAAKAWGVPQPTLYRYVNRVTETPKALVLQRVARFYDTTVEWLLEGTGPNPLELDYPTSDFRAWEALVKTLNLPEQVERALVPLPSRIASAHEVLCNWGLFQWHGKRVSQERARPARHGRYLAGAMEFQAWTVWLRGLIASYGRLAVRNKLVSELDRVQLGFQAFAMYLQMSGRVTGDLGTIHDEEFRRPGQPRVAILLNDPPAPPLNAARARQPVEGPASSRSTANRKRGSKHGAGPRRGGAGRLHYHKW